MKKLLLALRVVRNYRLYTIVNVLGLALSLACVITISRYLYSELTVDSIHSKRANIYAVMSSEQNSFVRRISAAVNHNKRSDFVDIAVDAAVMAKIIVLFGENENIVSSYETYGNNEVLILRVAEIRNAHNSFFANLLITIFLNRLLTNVNLTPSNLS